MSRFLFLSPELKVRVCGVSIYFLVAFGVSGHCSVLIVGTIWAIVFSRLWRFLFRDADGTSTTTFSFLSLACFYMLSSFYLFSLSSLCFYRFICASRSLSCLSLRTFSRFIFCSLSFSSLSYLSFAYLVYFSSSLWIFSCISFSAFCICCFSFSAFSSYTFISCSAFSCSDFYRFIRSLSSRSLFSWAAASIDFCLCSDRVNGLLLLACLMTLFLGT